MDNRPIVFDGHLVLAGLVGHHSQQMDCIDVPRVDRQDLPVDLLGRLPTASLMVPDGDRQCFGNRCHAVCIVAGPAACREVVRAILSRVEPPPRGRARWTK